MRDQRWQNWMILALGAWLFVSPFMLEHAQTVAGSNAHIIGVAVLLFSILALIESRVWEEWVNFVLGMWLTLSPFALGYSDLPAPAWNHLIVGLLVGGHSLIVIVRPASARGVAR